jgi:antitoxin HicB
MPQLYKVPLLLAPQREGGYTVTSPLLPELVTEIDSLDDLSANVSDAVEAALDAYAQLGKPLPPALRPNAQTKAVRFEHLVTA